MGPAGETDAAPLIVTLGFEAADQARFDVLRQRHFPPGLNHIPAHLTLFHHLPGTDVDAVADSLHVAAARQHPFTVDVTALRSLGRGVAYTLESAPLARMRRLLATRWHEQLQAQDRQGWRPHVTIQNKVAPREAADLLTMMRAAFVPFVVHAESLLLWRYRGGPWEGVGRHPFAATVPALPTPPASAIRAL